MKDKTWEVFSSSVGDEIELLIQHKPICKAETLSLSFSKVEKLFGNKQDNIRAVGTLFLGKGVEPPEMFDGIRVRKKTNGRISELNIMGIRFFTKDIESFTARIVLPWKEVK